MQFFGAVCFIKCKNSSEPLLLKICIESFNKINPIRLSADNIRRSMNHFPKSDFQQSKFLSPVKLSFGFLTIVLMLNIGVILGIGWNKDLPTTLAAIFSSENLNLLHIFLISSFAIMLGAWLLVVYRFRVFYGSLLKTDHERKLAEDALRSSESTVRELLENANDLIYTTDLEGNFTSLNKAGEILTGFTREEACSQNIKDIIAPEYLEFARNMTANKLNGGNQTRYEIDIITKSGGRLTIDLSTRLILESGKPSGVQGIARDVSQRRRDDLALRKSEAKYSSLVDSLPAIVYVVEPEPPFKPVYVSPNIEALGYSQKTWANEPDFWNSIIHPEDREEILRKNSEALTVTFEKELEYRVIAADGSEHWILDRGKYVADDGGKLLYWQGVMIDISERKRVAEAMVESERIYRFLGEGIQHQLWTAFPDGRPDYISGRATEYFGCTVEEIVEKGWKNFVHPEDVEERRNKWRHSLITGSVFECKSRLKSARGEYRWHVSRGSAARDENGQIVKWLGTNTDVDEQVRADAALRASESRYRTLLEHMGEGLAQVNNDSVVEFVNDRFCEMTGYSMDELLGKKISDFLYGIEDVNILKARDQRLLDGIAEHYELGLKRKTGERLWVLVGGAPTFNEDGAIIGSMGVFTDITERKIAEDKLMHDAFHDALTGLANRALFIDHLRLRIERAKRERNAVFGVLFLDFDRFKVINDSLGHAEGDKLLIAVAQRLESTLRSSDLIVRLGGDEFTMLLNELDDAAHASQIAERIQDLFSVPFALDSGDVFMSASIGIAIGTDGSVSAQDMLRNADIAMYRAKAKGKARHQVFDQAMHDEALNQLQIETDLRQALGRNEFRMHYQPIFNLQTRRIVGFEALIRWCHPKRGMVSPAEFVPIVEENGLIIPLGRWILFESCRQMREWLDNYPAAKDLTMSVNLSVKQFSQTDLAEQVMANLVATRLDPRFLKLEITESHVMENGEAAVKMMNRLRALGTEISLDDFGTGYSSLSYLHRLPVTNLKIDRSFVNQMVTGDENSKLVSTIITLAHNMNIQVTAEGIETADQLVQLRELNCELGQGYYFSKPLESDAATEIINSLPELNRAEITEHERNLELIG